MHFEKPGQISLSKEHSAYKFNLENSDISHFFLHLANKLDASLKDSSFDFFIPLGSSG